MPSFNESVTIAGYPISIDVQGRVAAFLAHNMPTEQNLFARWMPSPKGHPAVLENLEEITPPYPPLPPIEVGELQWPSGMSRYARALYAVDRVSMWNIAKAAWGMDVELKDFDGVEIWGESVNYLQVSISGDEEQFLCQMLPLPPYRVPGDGADLWLLPLVDMRFLKQQEPFLPDSFPADWDAMFAELGSQLGIGVSVGGSIASEYGIPDWLTIKNGVSAAALLDCCALSIGRRVVIDPVPGNAARIINSSDSNARWDVLNAKRSRVAGANRGVAVAPGDVGVFCRKAWELSLLCNLQEQRTGTINGYGTYSHLAHSAWVIDYRLFGGVISPVNELDTGYYIDKVASDMDGWLDSGGQMTFAGSLNYAPTGYDDYCTIKTAEGCFTSRVVELPPVFLPHMLLSQWPGLVLASQVDQFVADSTTVGGLAVSTSRKVNIAGLVAEDVDKTVTAFYRCGQGWTRIDATPGGVDLFAFTLTADLSKAQGATATANAFAANVLTGPTSGITVVNPGRFRAFTGATGIAAKVGESYWILQVDQPARVRVVLNANPTSSGTGASVRFGADPRSADCYFKTTSPNQPVALTAWPFNFLPDLSSGTAPNPRDLMGVDGDFGILEWDDNANGYYLAHVYPATQQLFYATLNADRSFANGATIACNFESPASIGAVPSNPFNVVDAFNTAFGARSSDRVLVHRDAVNNRYIVVAARVRALYVFQMTNPWVGGATAAAAITRVDGIGTGQTATVWDPQLIFAALTVGSSGYCYWEDGRFVTIQAGCPE